MTRVICLCFLFTMVGISSGAYEEKISIEQYDAEIARLQKIKKQLQKEIVGKKDRASSLQFSREMGGESRKAYEEIYQLEDHILWIDWQIQKLQKNKVSLDLFFLLELFSCQIQKSS